MTGEKRRTPPGGSRMQSQTERDMKAFVRMREERARSQAEEEASMDDATPKEFEGPEEVTKPHQILDFRNQNELDIIQKRYDMDPAFRALWNLIRRQRHESNRTLGKVADSTTSVHQDLAQLVELGKKLEDIATWKHQVDVMLKITKWVLGLVFTIALGSVIVMATKIYTWGVSSGELEIRVQHLEKAMERRNSNPGYQYPSPTGASTQPFPLPGVKQ